MKLCDIIQWNMENISHRKTALIGFLGDSVTQGCFEVYRDRSNGLQTVFDNESGYPNRLKQLFDTVYPQASVSILNAGISGDTAPNGARRVKEAVIDHRPQLAIVCYGLNDSGRGAGGLQDYAEALADIFRRLKEARIDVIFMTPNMKAPYVTHELDGLGLETLLRDSAESQSNGTMDLYMEKARQVCRAEGVTVCDCYAKWKRLAQSGADITRLLANRINHPAVISLQ